MSERIVLFLGSDPPPEPASDTDSVSVGHPQPPPSTKLMVLEPDGVDGLWSFGCLVTEEVFYDLASGVQGADVVAAAGRRLFSELVAKPEVSGVISAALGVPAGQRRPVYVYMSGADACQELPWEALCTDDGQFLALNRWPVARMLASTAGDVTARKLRPPLRIAAILSCRGVDPREEWMALRQAVELSPDVARVLLLLSDPNLHDELLRLRLPWLEVALIPIDYLDLRARVTAFAPQVLHFFCHGDTKGSPHLQIATATDLLAPQHGSTYRLEAREIRDLVQQPTEAPWAVVLNACSSAATGRESGARSLAASLVREHGLQVAIGMREPVLSTNAACFTRTFYGALLTEVNRYLTGNVSEVELDWASLTVDARAQLCMGLPVLAKAAAASHKVWTLPVVTVRRAPFRVEVETAASTRESELARMIDEYKAIMRLNIASTAPAETVAAFEASSTLVLPVPSPVGAQPSVFASSEPEPEVAVISGVGEAPESETFHRVRIDAWTGAEAASSPLGEWRDRWATAAAVLPRGLQLAPQPPQAADWRDPEVGWGLVLPEPVGFSADQLRCGEDISAPLRALIESRPASKVLRYRRGGQFQSWVLRDYAGGTDRPIDTSPMGTGPKAIPAYLLSAGSPAEIPWEVQYQLNLVRKVGRLDLPPEGLANYVNALIGNWSDSTSRYSSPLVWAVDHGGGDITALMRDAVAEPTHAAFVADEDLSGATFIDGRTAHATAEALCTALRDRRPAVVLTTSHGQTGPLDQVDVMRERLGALVDSRRECVDPAALLSGWQPDGAVWLAQACCSAGTTAPSMYDGLFEQSSLVGSVLKGLTEVGPIVAPLPRALLGASRPLRAFIGHVEPTFDWTMLFPPTREQLADWVRETLYSGVCGGLPVGLAMENARIYHPVGALLLRHVGATASYAVATARKTRRSALDLALYSKVTAYDRASTVLLGDPTAAVPLPVNQ